MRENNPDRLDLRAVRSYRPDVKRRRASLLADARLYLCTDSRAERGDLRDFLHAAYEGGVDIIQLRNKKIEAREEIKAVEILANVSRQHGKLFAVNDRADVAALVDADVFHVGQGDLTTAQARAILGDDILMGRSNRTESMFRASLLDDGLDYAVIGPVWRTPTKPNRAPVGLQMIKRANSLAEELTGGRKPWFAIGGINDETVDKVVGQGASRIVVVRAITTAQDPDAAARTLAQVMRER